MEGKIKTKKLCYDHSTDTPFNAEILELREYKSKNEDAIAVLLDKSIFYPEGGGQLSDLGSINGVRLLNVIEHDDEMLHLISTEDSGSLKPGSAELLLDSRRRRDHSQLHTGQHILSGTLFRMTGARTVSMHMGEETCTIDVDAKELSIETLNSVEDAIADIIEENRRVTLHLCPPEDITTFPLRRVPPIGEEVIRVLEIEDCDIIACCGTHVKSTAEVGMLRILGAEKYKGMTRITFIAGRRVLLDSRKLRENAGIISRALSIPVMEIGKGVLELIEKMNRGEKRLKAYEERETAEKAEALIVKANAAIAGDSKRPAIIIEYYPVEDSNTILNIGKIAQKKTMATLILISETELKFAGFASEKDFDLREFLKEAFEKHRGKGGGSPSFFQGSFDSRGALDEFTRALVN
ncbi:MAG: DHHA1 domain-containing protein [Treponema sp.]|nr:DHHA1 domain-containing protein [Treponema sp.]